MSILLQESVLFSATEIAVPLPPHGESAIGRAEDAAQNCLRLRPRAPRKDLNKFLQYSGKVSSLPLKMIHLWDTSYPFHMQLEIGLGFSLDWDFPACPTTERKGFFEEEKIVSFPRVSYESGKTHLLSARVMTAIAHAFVFH